MRKILETDVNDVICRQITERNIGTISNRSREKGNLSNIWTDERGQGVVLVPIFGRGVDILFNT